MPAVPSAVVEFWAAVAATSEGFVADLLAGQGRRETPEFATVAARLAVVDPGLSLVVGGAGDRPEIVVSAGGLRELFPVVRMVVDAAPAEVTDRFVVKAFRPRVPDPAGMRVRVKGRDLGVIDVHWDAKRYRRDPTRCDLVLYVPGYLDGLAEDSTANGPLVEAVFLLLDHLVGEWAVTAQIRWIQWRSAAESEGLPTLLALPEYLDQISAS